MIFWPSSSYSNFHTDQTVHKFHDLDTELDLHRITGAFYGVFAMGVACQQGMLILPDTWFRPFFGSYLCNNCWDQFFRTNRVFSRLFHLYLRSPKGGCCSITDDLSCCRISLGTFSILLAKWKKMDKKSSLLRWSRDIICLYQLIRLFIRLWPFDHAIMPARLRWSTCLRTLCSLPTRFASV